MSDTEIIDHTVPRLSAGKFIRGTRIVFGRELEAYFDSPIAYIYAAVFLVLSCTTFMNSFFLDGIVDMSPYFEILPFLLIPFVPAITMRAWAEEHAQHTFELLMTLPLHSSQAVLGKFLAALSFYALVLAGSLPIVLMLVFLGDPDLGLIFSSYLGALLLGAFFLSFGSGSNTTAGTLSAAAKSSASPLTFSPPKAGIRTFT